MSKVIAKENDSSKEDKEQFPLPLPTQIFTKIYNSVPKVYFPGSNIDVSITALTIPFLYTAREIFGHILIGLFDWPSSSSSEEDYVKTKESIATFVAMLHATLLLPGLHCALFKSKVSFSPSEKLVGGDAPKFYVDLSTVLLQFCTGYMIYDCIFGLLLPRYDAENNSLILTAADKLFLGHHLTTVFYMNSSRIINAGHQSALMCMYLGEITNPPFSIYGILQNSNTLDCCSGGSFSNALNTIIGVLFPSLYLLMRVFVGPVACAYMSYDLLITKKGRANVNIVLAAFWVMMQWGVILGSIGWVMDCYDMLLKNTGLNNIIVNADEL